jgi:MFS family permease
MRMFRLGAWGVALPPSSSALVVSIAPESRRGIYLALNSLCWAIGYLLGPPLGGFALDLPRPWADAFWVVLRCILGCTEWYSPYCPIWTSKVTAALRSSCNQSQAELEELRIDSSKRLILLKNSEATMGWYKSSSAKCGI